MNDLLLSSKTVLKEDDPEVHAIEGTPTSTAAAVGVTVRGPLTRKRITSVGDFRKFFGGYTGSGEVAQAVDGFYTGAPEGTPLYIQRVVHHTDVTNPTTKTSDAATLATDIKTAAIGASAGVVTGSIAGPWSLDDGDTLSFSVDGAGSDVATFNAAAALRESTGTETFALSNGETLTVKIDQGVVQTIEFLTAEFVAIGAATAEEVAAVINAKIVGASAAPTSGGTKVTITSDTKGTGSYVEVTGGTANVALSFNVAEVQGTGDAADASAVTATEMKTLIEGDVAGVTVSEHTSGYLVVTSDTTGAASSVLVEAASTADTELGFDNATHSGSDAAQYDTLGVDAKTDGTYGNTKSVKISAATSGVASEFNFTVMEGTLELEVFPNVTMDDDEERFIENIVNDADNGSWYVTVTDLDAGAGSSTADRPLNGTYGPMSGGDDGLTAIADSDYVGGSSTNGKTGLRGLDDVLDLRLLTVPGRATSVVHNAMVSYCEVTRGGSVFPILDPPSNTTAENMVTYVVTTAALLNLSEFGAIFWPRIEVANPDKATFGNSDTMYAAPSGYLAGLFARQDQSSTGGVYQAAAGVENGILLGCLGFEDDSVILEETRDLLATARINPISFETGWPRFVDGHDTLKANGNFPSIPERRGVIFIEQSIKQGTTWCRHKNNDEALRERLDRDITSFLVDQMDAGAFRSKDPAKAFFVDVGAGLNPASAVFAGKVYGKIGLATQKPAKFVILTFSQDTRAFTTSSNT